MKIVIFQGTSQYDVMRYFSRHLADAFRNLGHEVILWDLLVHSSDSYFNMTNTFNPDFTIGFNPVGIISDDIPHYEMTNTPHFVYLADHPYYHVYDRMLKNPDHPLVYTVAMGFSDAFQSLNVRRVTSDFPFGTTSNLSTSSRYDSYRPIPVFFSGSIEYPGAIEKAIRNEFNGSIQRIVLGFLSFIKEWMDQNNSFLPAPIEQCFAEYINIDTLVKEDMKVPLLRKVFPAIERYYRNYTRLHVVESFVKQGIPMLIAGPQTWKELLNKYPNVTFSNPVGYQEYLELTGLSKVALNVTPAFFEGHDRVPTTLMAGALLCTSPFPKLTDHKPELLNAMLFYNWGNYIEQTGDVIKQLLANDEERLLITKTGQEMAKKYFSWEVAAEKFIETYKEVF